MDPDKAYHVIGSFIARERGMREHVFRNDDEKKKQKTDECDRAMEALEALKIAAGLAQQGSLFK